MSSGIACMDDGGILRAMRYDITFLPGFDTLNGCPPVGSTRSGHYGITTEQCLYSSPAIADLDKDDKLEVVIGSGVCYSGGNWVKVWDSDGNLERTFSTDNSVFTSPALADLNGDGYLDIIAGTESGTVYAWDYHSKTTLWSVKPKTCSRTWGMLIRSSPAVADIDGAHAGPEIIIGYDAEVTVLSADGQQLTADSWSDPRPTLWVGISPVWSSPAVGDINGDDQLEIIVGGISLGFLCIYLVEREQWWALIPGGILAAIAFVMLLATATEYILPVALILLGILLLRGVLGGSRQTAQRIQLFGDNT